MAQNSYTLGQVVRLSVAFTDSAAAAVDPTTVTLKIKDPVGAEVTKTYALSEVIKDSAGIYHFDHTPTLEGSHHYRWEGTAPSTAAESRFFMNSDY